MKSQTPKSGVFGPDLSGTDMPTVMEALEEISTLSINHPSDRCDRCGAEAFYLAVRADLALYFCGHHGSKHVAALRDQHWQVLDDTDKINQSPSVSANAE